jgi:hypothetical protein
LNWDAAIEIHRLALLRLLAGMYAALGIEAGESVQTVRAHLRLMVLRILGPAESAVRRLVFLKARDLPEVDYQPRPAQKKNAKRSKKRSASKAFTLFDRQIFTRPARRKHPKGIGPSVYFFDGSDTPPQRETRASSNGLVNAESLCRRLQALFDALNDLDKQAQRLKRAEARRKLSPRFWDEGVMREGPPPGHRAKGRSAPEVTADSILSKCQELARWWTAEQDTS